LGAWRSEYGLSWRSLQPFGAEVDCDLSRLGGAADRFYALLRETGYVLARGQALTMEQQKTLMAPIGPFVLREGYDSGFIANDGPSDVSRSELSYHADACYTDAPFAAISLHAIDVVDDASSTRFVSAERAYATLPAALKEHLDRLDVEMIFPAVDYVARRVCDVADPAANHRQVLPAVRINPRTGRPCIGVCEMNAARVVGMPLEDGRDLLHAVYDHLYAPENVVEHFWRRGDIVVWDNLTLQHARGSTAGVGRRILQRVVAGADAHQHYPHPVRPYVTASSRSASA